MPKIVSSAPVLIVSDVVASAEYFRECVGFGDTELYNEPPTFAICNRDGHYLMLAEVEDPTQIRPHWQIVDKLWNAYFWVDDVEELYQELTEAGAKIDYSLCTQPYGVREFGIQDLDGHDIAFGQVLGDNADDA